MYASIALAGYVGTVLCLFAGRLACIPLGLIATGFSLVTHERGKVIGRPLTARAAIIGCWIYAIALSFGASGPHSDLAADILGFTFVLGFAVVGYPTFALARNSWVS